MQVAGEKEIEKDPAPQEGAKEIDSRGVAQEVKSEAKILESVGFMYCTKIWFLSLSKALVVVTPVLVLLWVYFLPGLVMSADHREDLEEFIYEKVGIVLCRASFNGFAALYMVSVFGFYFMRKPLFFCLLLGLILGIFIEILSASILGKTIDFFVIISVIIFVYVQKLPDDPSPIITQDFERKREIAKPAGKIFAIVWIVYFVLRVIYPMFLNASSQGKMFIRFVILPFFMTCCTSLQSHVLKSVEKKYVDFLIPMIWITNGFLKMYERIFTNGIFKGGDYFSFAATTLFAATIEVINHALYFQRATIVNRSIKAFRNLRKPSHHPVQKIYIDQNDESRRQNDMKDQKPGNENEWLVDIRRKLIIEDISLELMMILTVTFLLYFIHPLIENEKIGTLPTFEICIIQILIQVAFETISDIFGIYWTITRQKIDLKPSDVDIKNKWFWVWIFFIMWQSLLIFRFLFIS